MSNIKEIVRRYKYTVIGEIHGIQENVDFLEDILKQCISDAWDGVIFAFEWPLTKEENKVLSSFVSGETDSTSDQFKSVLGKLFSLQSGVFSDQHLSFIKELRDINLNRSKNFIDIIAFDPDLTNWNKRDKQMAMCIMEASKKADTVIIVTGDLHARKHPFRLNGVEQDLYPLASHFPPKETFSVKLKYEKGKFFNFGVQDIPSKKESGGEEEDFHDIVYSLKQATPVTFKSEVI